MTTFDPKAATKSSAAQSTELTSDLKSPAATSPHVERLMGPLSTLAQAISQEPAFNAAKAAILNPRAFTRG